MPLILKTAILSFFSYILGSIPFALIISKRIKGMDIRKFGSGNVGATNVARALGRKWGVLVFILDFLKGFLPVMFSFYFLPEAFDFKIISIFIGICSVSGHNWPVFLKFKGGKGVSVSIGVVTALSVSLSFMRIPVIAAFSVWVIVFLIFKIVGIASLAFALILFSVCLFLHGVPLEYKLFSLLIALFIFVRHKKNIRDILDRLQRTGRQTAKNR